MATVNIRRDVTDPFYRYKMEKLQSKIEGKGNGIKSVIVNLPSVANSLARPPIYVVKYFGFELGAQTNTGDHDRWIINGAHEATKLQELLDGFITKFVLCKECQNPETDLSISKDQNIIRNCKACGQRTKVDPRLKLSGYILKNPPQKEKKEKKDKKEKKKAKANGEENKEGSNSEEEAGKNGNGHVVPTSNLDQYNAEAGSDDEFTRGITDAAKGITGAGDGADAFTIDTSEKAMKERQKNELTSAVEKLTMGGNDEEEEEESGSGPYDQFATWFDDQAKHLGGVAKVDDIEIYKKLTELGLERKHKTLQVLAQTLFDADVAKQISPRAGLLKKLVSSDRHEKAFLGGIERLVGKQFPKLIPTMPNILHPIYDKEIISEDAILKWGAKATKRYVDTATSKKVKAASEPFLTWLQEADEDESDEEEEDEDDE